MGQFYSIESGNNKFIKTANSLVESGKYSLAFIALDISNFKYINDFYGMAEGDKVMEKIASFFFIDEPLCLVSYGMGFDQFRGIYKMDQLSRSEMIDYLTRKSHQFESELSALYPLVYNHVYIGIYFYDEQDKVSDVRLAIDWSNLAKKAIKNNFNTNCHVFGAAGGKEHLNNMYISNLFMHSAANDSIDLYIQPKVSHSKGEVVGGEALVRMRDKSGNIIMPGVFVPLLEKTGLVDRLDKIMLEKVFAFQQECLSKNMNVYPISVNVSKQEFTTPCFAEHIFDLQKQYNVDPSLVEFELVESTFINDLSRIVDTIKDLRNAGFQINVDDFGAGYSSLNQIANIPADIIKMDGMFARESLKTEKGRTVIKSLIAMLDDIDYDIVFEGIESKEQLDLITSYGCDTIQGFYYSKPIKYDEFILNYGKNRAVKREIV